MIDTDAVFHMPDLGEGLEEAELVAWHVSVGDRVVADQPLASVETDKAVVETPSPQTGVIAKLFAKPGDIVKVGAPLVAFGSAEADAGAIVGDLPAAAPSTRGDNVLAAPAARALARETGLDLKTIKPAAGPEGHVALADVRAALSDRTPEAAKRPATDMPAAPETDTATPLRGPRRAMARAMSAARDHVSRATVTDRADVASWAAGDADVTFRLIRAMARACQAEPALNAWYDEAAETIIRHARVDLGIAVDTPDGLFVPVLRDAQVLSANEIQAERARLLAAVRARRATPADLRNPTISLSNFGMIAGRHADLVVVPPQVAILGAGRIGPEWVDRGGTPAVSQCLPLSLSFDHRAVSGGEAARFLRAAIDDLERAD